MDIEQKQKRLTYKPMLIDANEIVTTMVMDEKTKTGTLIKTTIADALDKWTAEGCPKPIEADPKRDFEVVVNEACLNCELDCVEVVRCHDCSNYEEAKNGCNGFCKEWNTSTYTWDYCSRGERKDGGEDEN